MLFLFSVLKVTVYLMSHLKDLRPSWRGVDLGGGGGEY